MTYSTWYDKEEGVMVEFLPSCGIIEPADICFSCPYYDGCYRSTVALEPLPEAGDTISLNGV